MKINNYLITLKQPVIISESSASVGAHQSLDYIKGSTLLGLLASRLYSHLKPEDAFMLFHSGKVRFNDALPVSINSHQVAYPVPMSLHSFKAEKYANEDNLLANKIFDMAKASSNQVLQDSLKQKQPVQLRGFYLTHNGKRVSPLKEHTLKTAIDPNQNRAKESQLFGYEALSANQQFSFSIQADDDVPEELWEKLTSSVIGKAHLGRSRSAQFGAVEIQEDSSLQVTKPSIKQDNQLTLWLLSDLQIHKDGQPTLIPEPELLGLPEGTKWQVESSFLRSRSYSMYNAYRRHYDKERQVISRGSVLRYQLPAGFSEFDALQTKLSKGIGLQTELGLGQVWVNPVILSDVYPSWQQDNALNSVASKASVVKAPVNSTLISTLFRKQQVAEIGSQPRQIAADIFNEMCKKIAQARRYQGLLKGMPLIPSPPSRAQFGRFKELANQNRNDSASLWDVLVTSENAILKITTEGIDDNRQSGASYKSAGWELKYEPNPQSSLGQFLQDQLQPYKNEKFFAYIVAELAILGLSETWEDFCIGNKPNVSELNHQATKNEEYA